LTVKHRRTRRTRPRRRAGGAQAGEEFRPDRDRRDENVNRTCRTSRASIGGTRLRGRKDATLYFGDFWLVGAVETAQLPRAPGSRNRPTGSRARSGRWTWTSWSPPSRKALPGRGRSSNRQAFAGPRPACAHPRREDAADSSRDVRPPRGGLDPLGPRGLSPDSPWNQSSRTAAPPRLREDHCVHRARQAAALQPDMAFILVPPDQPRQEVKIVEYGASRTRGPFCSREQSPSRVARGYTGSQGSGLTLRGLQPRQGWNRGGDRHGSSSIP